MININRIKESQTGTDTLIECQEEGKGQSQREYDTQRITNNCKKKPCKLEAYSVETEFRSYIGKSNYYTLLFLGKGNLNII